jgi:hypothetical protein
MSTPRDPTPAQRAPAQSSANSTAIVRYLGVAGLALLALLTLLEPDVGFEAPPAARLLFWGSKIAVGLVVLQSVLYLLSRRYGASRASSAVLVLLSGALGSVVLAPVYWLIGDGLMQDWLGYPVIADEDGDDPSGFSTGHLLLDEYLDIVAPVTAAWALICLPRLHFLVPPLLLAQTGAAETVAPPTVAPVRDDVGRAAPFAQADEPGSGHPDAAPSGSPLSTVESADPGATTALAAGMSSGPDWSERLPSALGTDVIAVASELQYLRVWTTRGCALILGALADVESQGAHNGLRVHRSWWVACDHIIAVRRTATGTVCLMSDGRQVPVSRRRRAEVVSRFGSGASYRVGGPSEAVSQTDLH